MNKDPQDVLSLISNLREKHVPDDSGEISLPDERLREMNEKRYQGQDTNLMMLVKFGKREDVKLFLKIKGLEVNKKNKKDDTAADIAWDMKSYDILMILLQNDSFFPRKFSVDEVDTEGAVKDELKQLVEERERLHKWIEENKLEAIKEFIKYHKPSLYYATDNVSALSRALQYEKKDISSHFANIMPKFSILEMAKEHAEKNVLYSGIMDKLHLRQLLSGTRFSEEYSKEEFEAIITMYQILEKQRKISCLFKAIQNEKFEIIFAMKTEIFKTDVEGETKEVYGYTELNGQIFIAGKGINTKVGKPEVYRVFAHEFCHLVMQFMYKNNFKPYLPHDEKRISAFSIICEDIHKKHEDMHEIFKKVYEVYHKNHWHHELIVRIPEMMVLSGEENAFKKFGEQISELDKYYEEYIVKDCEEFSDNKFYSPELKELKNISNDHLVVPICFPEFAKTENYEKYLVPWKARGYKFSFLPTSIPELGALRIIYELKKLHADRRCLAFKLKHYYNMPNGMIISNAYDKSNGFEKLILVMPDTMVNCEPKRIYDDIHFSSTNEKEVIVVVSSELCDKYPEWKVKEKLQFNWNDLSKVFKNKLLEKTVVYQGERKSLKEVFESFEPTPDILKNIMSDKEMCIGKALSSVRDEKDMYIPRTFVRSVYKKDNFQVEQMPSDYLFMTGDSELKIENLEKWSQTLSKYDEQIDNGKYIFIPKNKENNSEFFKNVCSNIEKKSKQVFWIHHTNGKYLLREPLERSEDIKNHFVEETFDEKQMLKETDGMSAVLVADDPGTGKSKSITSLIEKMKESYPKKLILRVNFGEHLHEFAASPPPQSLIEFLQQICNMNNPLEKMAFKSFIDIPKRIVVFFDGFDEMTKDLQTKTRKTLQLLREETKIQIWIFTRKHERLILEEEMNTVSFSLRQFSFDDQRVYLNAFWVQRLDLLNQEKKDSDEKYQEILKNLKDYSGKCERLLKDMEELVKIPKVNQEEFRKKINEMDFGDYAELVINSVKDIILKGKVIVPLWLWMIANIIIDSNFEIPDQTNRFTFYSNFLDKKVDSYITDECGISSHSKKQWRIYNIYRKIIFKNLRKFSVRVMKSDLKKRKEDDLKEDDKLELVDVGLLRKVGEEHHFFHMTFAEFLFSQIFVEEIESVNAKLLSDILIKDSYREVRIFLDDFLEKSESQSLVDDFIEKKKSFVFPKILLQKFKLFKIFSEICNRINDRKGVLRKIIDKTGYWIWRSIFQSCEIHRKECVDENSILSVLNISPFNRSDYSLDGVLVLLNSTFTDRMLFIMFDSRVDESGKFLFRCLKYIESNDLNAMMSIFKKIINYKISHLRSEVPSTDNSRGNVKVGLKIFEKEYKDEYGNSVLHLMTKGRKGRVLEDLIEIQSMIGNGQLKKLLTVQNEDGMTMLHILMEYLWDPKNVISVLEYVEGVMEGDLFRQFLIQKDNRGIFPVSYAKLHSMKHMLVFMRRNLSNQDIIHMFRENKELLWKSIREADCALEEILNLEEYLGSELLQEILISKDEVGRTRLHNMMMRHNERADKLFVSDLKVYASFLDRVGMRAFLFSQDCNGLYRGTFLHQWAESYRGPQNFDIIFRELHSILSPDAFEDLLNIRNKYGRTFIHMYKGPLSELSSSLEEFLGKEKSIKLVTAKDNRFSRTRLHYYHNYKYKYELLRKDLKFYSELLDESSFRDFILTKDRNGETFCSDYDLSDLNKLKGILSPDLLSDLQKTVELELEPKSKRLRMS